MLNEEIRHREEEEVAKRAWLSRLQKPVVHSEEELAKQTWFAKFKKAAGCGWRPHFGSGPLLLSNGLYTVLKSSGFGRDKPNFACIALAESLRRAFPLHPSGKSKKMDPASGFSCGPREEASPVMVTPSWVISHEFSSCQVPVRPKLRGFIFARRLFIDNASLFLVIQSAYLAYLGEKIGHNRVGCDLST